MEREKDEVVQRKTQLEQVRKLYHAAKRDGTDEKLAIVEKDASAAEKILKDAENEEVAEQKLQTLKEKMFKASQELVRPAADRGLDHGEMEAQSQVKNLRHKIRA